MTNVTRGLAEEVCFFLCRKVTFAVHRHHSHQSSMPTTLKSVKDLIKLSDRLFKLLYGNFLGKKTDNV